MKKISLFILAVVLAVACSSDNQESSNGNTQTSSITPSTARASLEQLYADMLNSPSYIEFKGAAENFADKMNYSGDTTLLKSDVDILNWIGNNLTRTSFSSINQATAELAEVNRLSGISVQNNFSFFEAVADEPVRGQIILTPEPPTSAFRCDQCVKQFKASVDQAVTSFLNDVIGAFTSVAAGGSGAAASIKIANARTILTISIDIAAEQFVACCS